MTTDSFIAPVIEPVAAPPRTSLYTRVKDKTPQPSMIFAIVWLGTLTFLAIFADYLPFVRGYAQRVPGATNFAYGPGNDFWFGSDQLGRDVFARCIYGARVSLIVATASIIAGLVIGGTIGLIAGFRKGAVDRGISVLTDSLLALPALIAAILVVGRFDALRNNNSAAFGWLSRT